MGILGSSAGDFLCVHTEYILGYTCFLALSSSRSLLPAPHLLEARLRDSSIFVGGGGMSAHQCKTEDLMLHMFQNEKNTLSLLPW